MSEVIEIVAYNPDWPRMFEDENGSDFQLQEEYTRRGAVSPGTFVPVLILEGKCLHWRAKSAHLGGHLPVSSPLYSFHKLEKLPIGLCGGNYRWFIIANGRDFL